MLLNKHFTLVDKLLTTPVATVEQVISERKDLPWDQQRTVYLHMLMSVRDESSYDDARRVCKVFVALLDKEHGQDLWEMFILNGLLVFFSKAAIALAIGAVIFVLVLLIRA